MQKQRHEPRLVQRVGSQHALSARGGERARVREGLRIGFCGRQVAASISVIQCVSLSESVVVSAVPHVLCRASSAPFASRTG